MRITKKTTKLVDKWVNKVLYNREQEFDYDIHNDIFDMIYEFLPSNINYYTLKERIDKSMCIEIEKFYRDLVFTVCSQKWIRVNLLSFIQDFQYIWNKELEILEKIDLKGEEQKNYDKFHIFVEDLRTVKNSRYRLKEKIEKWKISH